MSKNPRIITVRRSAVCFEAIEVNAAGYLEYVFSDEASYGRLPTDLAQCRSLFEESGRELDVSRLPPFKEFTGHGDAK